MLDEAEIFCLQLVLNNKLPRKCDMSDQLNELIVKAGYDMFVYFYKAGVLDSKKSMNYAAKYGNKDILYFGRGHGVRFDRTTMNNAAEYGHLECLQFLVARDHYYDSETLYAAVRGNQPDIVRHLLSKTYDGVESAAVQAAKYGHLECFIILRGNYMVNNKECLFVAIKHGRTNIIEQIALTNDLTYHYPGIYEQAVDHNQRESLRYLLINGLPRRCDEAYVMATKYNKVELLQYIHDQRIVLTAITKRECLRWSHNHDAIAWILAH